MAYPHAPITEAVMDIRVEPRDGLDVEELRTLNADVLADYPEAKEQISGVALFQIGEKPEAGLEQTKVGFRFQRRDGANLFQAQLTGFSFNKLAPYQNWEEFSREGREVWTRYKKLAQPKKITRVALRYINRIDMPMPVEDFRQYLRTFPEVSPDLPQGVSNFFMQVQIPQDDIGALLHLNMTMVPPAREGVASLVLDQDLFRAAEIPQGEEELWLYFEQLRIRKNKVFEACITEATRELFR